MKKIFTILGSLLVFAGVKAQTVTTVKKETVKPVTDTAVVADSMKTQLKNTSIKQTTPAIKKTYKTTNVTIKLSGREGTKPMKD